MCRESFICLIIVVRALRDKNRSRANCVPIYGDLYQNLQWSLTFDLKVVTHLKSASEASYDVINMATIMRNCSLINAMVCVGMVICTSQFMLIQEKTSWKIFQTNFRIVLCFTTFIHFVNKDMFCSVQLYIYICIY